MLSIGYTGVRDGEVITGISNAKQTAGVIMHIRGSYPPERKFVEELSDPQIRDIVAQIPFFHGHDVSSIRTYLLDNSTTKHKSYLEDYPIDVRFVSLGSNNDFTRILP